MLCWSMGCRHLGGNLSVLNENTTKASMGRLPVSQNPDPLLKETNSLRRLSISQNSDPAKESKTTGNVSGTPHRVNLNTARRTTQQSSVTVPNVAAPKRSSARANSAVNVSNFSKSDVVPVLVPRNDIRAEQAAERKEVGIYERSLEWVTESRREVGITVRSLESNQPIAESRKEVGMVGRASEQGADSRKELSIVGRTMPFSLQSKTSSFRKFQNSREDMDQPAISAPPDTEGCKAAEFSSVPDRSTFPSVKGPIHGTSAADMNVREDGCIGSVKSEPNSVLELPSRYRDENYDAQVQKSHGDAYPLESHLESRKGGRTRSVINWEKRRRSNFDGPSLSISSRNVSVTSMPSSYKQRQNPSSVEKEMPSTTDEDAVAVLMEQHGQFIGSMQSRLAKLQVVRQLWERNDIKGAISAMEKMADHAVLADVIGIVTEKMDVVTLEICTCLLPLLSGLLGSDMDRHLSICLDMLLKLVRTFGSMIYSTVSALTPTGVDIEAEQRFERCNLCFIELEKVKQCLPTLTRRGGSVAKSAQELNLALKEAS